MEKMNSLCFVQTEFNKIMYRDFRSLDDVLKAIMDCYTLLAVCVSAERQSPNSPGLNDLNNSLCAYVIELCDLKSQFVRDSWG